MNLPFLLWGFVVLNQDLFGERTCVSVQHCKQSAAPWSVPGDVKAELSQENVHPGDVQDYRENVMEVTQFLFNLSHGKGALC